MSAPSLPSDKKAILDTLAERLAITAMEVFVAMNRDTRPATDSELEIALKAMREAARPAVTKMMDDVKRVPMMAEHAFMVAVLNIANAGAKAWRARPQAAN